MIAGRRVVCGPLSAPESSPGVSKRLIITTYTEDHRRGLNNGLGYGTKASHKPRIGILL